MPQRTWVSSLPFGQVSTSGITSQDSGRYLTPLPYRLENADELKIDAIRCRLRGSSDESNALQAIREIGEDHLGSKEMGLFKVDDAKGVLWLYWSVGIDPEKYRMLDAVSEPVLRQVIEGETYIDGRITGTEFNRRAKDKKDRSGRLVRNVSAFIPILLNGRTVAVLAIFHLHPEKKCIDRSDKEIFHLLSTEAGRALFDSTKPFLTRLLEDQL